MSTVESHKRSIKFQSNGKQTLQDHIKNLELNMKADFVVNIAMVPNFQKWYKNLR